MLSNLENNDTITLTFWERDELAVGNFRTFGNCLNGCLIVVLLETRPKYWEQDFVYYFETMSILLKL